jgi:antitoxin component HigA of HigAB toxin-antitoxin module
MNMETTVKKIKQHAAPTPSQWRHEAEYRCENKSWLRYSQHIALLMQDKMDKMNLTQKELANQMSVSQQYVSKILKGYENFSLETLTKIEDILHINILVPEYA